MVQSKLICQFGQLTNLLTNLTNFLTSSYLKIQKVWSCIFLFMKSKRLVFMLENRKYLVTLDLWLSCLKASLNNGIVFRTSGDSFFLSCHSVSRRAKPKTKFWHISIFTALPGSWNYFWEILNQYDVYRQRY